MERFLVLVLVVLAMPMADPPGAEPVGGQVPDSIQAHLDAGRYWKASVGLRSRIGPVGSASIADRIALAQAESGWENWPGVIEALRTGDPDVSQADAWYWYLLGLGLQGTGDWDGGKVALNRFLELSDPGSLEALAVRSRLLQGADLEPVDSLLRSLASLRALSPVLADWTGLRLAEALKSAGRPVETGQVLDLIVDPDVGRTAWSWMADSWAEAGDSVRALAVLEEITDEERDAVGQAAVLSRVWRLRLATGDTTGAIIAAAQVLEHTVRGDVALEAAAVVLDHSTGLEVEHVLRAADAFSRGSDNRKAVTAWELASGRGAILSERERLSFARSLGAVGDRSRAAVEFKALSASDAPEVAAPALAALATIRRREGRREEASAIEDALVEGYPTRPEALSLVYFRGDDAQDAGNYERAISHYRQVISMSSSANQAGLARMRWGHIHLTRLEYGAAADVFEGYLEEFPRGRRWEEASYWGAWAAQQMGDEPRSARLAEKLHAGEPLSYYAVMATALGTYPFEMDLPDGGALPEPEWLDQELEVLRLLETAGLDRGAAAHVDAIKAAAWESEDVLQRLAVELNERGRTIEGIGIGWELRRRGREWDKTLLRVIYPFPYRRMVLSLARERNLDPYLLAGMIRQESAFVPDIVSRAGAVGLMQVIPSTGRQLARAVGPSGFRDDVLTTPEVNVHLGSRFLADLLRRYEEEMPLVLSAYNAGPSRADRWKRFPEAADPDRFTERIPFAETRGYVKNVTRNRALYRYLYGDLDQGGARP